GKTVAFLGLTFKPETDDMREAPALTIIPALINGGAKIRAADPAGIDEAKKLLPGEVSYFQDPYETAAGADALVLLTEWNQYRALDFDRLKNIMNKAVFIDLRNVFNPDKVKSSGFKYFGVGHGDVFNNQIN
ncbi:MAG TPA: UDP-glucose 6-dehydrogenase, partial [Actinobacteria bacterium]|nr:UDP-glucose 6-dehydrogenase [Actinomycetota bacterium]